MIRIDIEEVFELQERLEALNRINPVDAGYCSKGEPLEVDPKFKESFPFAGRNGTGFITSNWYLKGRFEHERKD